MAFSKFNRKSGDSLFFLPIGALNIIGLLLVNLATFQALGRLHPGAVIFTLMYLSFHAFQFQILDRTGVVLAREYIEAQFSDHRAMSFFFLLGFVGWQGLLFLGETPVLGSGIQSVFSVVPAMPQSVLFSQATSEVANPAFALFANVVTAGFVEEAFFLGVLPAVAIIILWRFGVKNRFALFVGATVSSAALFASFHQQTTAFTQFWFAAFTFAMILRGVHISDFLLDSVEDVAVFVSFVIGAHIGNNMWVTGGPVNFVRVLSAEPLLLGMSLLMFGIYVFWTVQFLQMKGGVEIV